MKANRKLAVLPVLCSIIFSSCGPDDPTYDLKTEVVFEKENTNNKLLPGQGIICKSPGNDCKELKNRLNQTKINEEFAVFKTYYDSNTLSVYFSKRELYGSLFTEMSDQLNDLRLGIIDGTYSVGISDTHVIYLYDTNMTSGFNVRYAFQL